MSTFLFSGPVFGPVHSRRLGNSLGINLLPVDGKVCSFDCVYCECGFNADTRPKSRLPTRAETAEKLEARLRRYAEEGVRIDALTFAGNGEPTAHPEFPEIIEDAIAIRDRWMPGAAVCVLTNAVNILKPRVAAALTRIEKPMLKLDSVDPDYVRLVNRPQCRVDIPKLVEAMVKLKGKCIIQTMFIKGSVDGRPIDNTADSFVLPWIEALKKIQPAEVSIYSLDRDVPCPTVLSASAEDLRRIGRLVEAAGIRAVVSAERSEVEREKEKD